jgi:hypothetical protein
MGRWFFTLLLIPWLIVSRGRTLGRRPADD